MRSSIATSRTAPVAPPALFSLLDSLDAPNLELFYERHSNVAQQSSLPLGQEKFELAECVFIPFNCGLSEFSNLYSLCCENTE
jgi:hypothetical protein